MTTPEETILEDFVDSGAFLKFSDTNIIEGIYKGLAETSFPSGDKAIAYQIEQNGTVKVLTSGSKRLAEHFLDSKAQIGNFVKITRILGATQYDTDYTVEASKDSLPF